MFIPTSLVFVGIFLTDSNGGHMIKAILFDIDNTLLDFDACVREAMKSGFRKFGLRSYEDHMFETFEKINCEMWREIEKGNLTFEELLQTRWNRVFAALDITFDGCIFEDFFGEFLFDCAIPVEGAAEILEYLEGRYILCVASNGPYAQQLNRLRNANMLSCFSKFFISEKIGASKPSEDFFSHCINELNKENKILPCEIMMIGDSVTSDIIGAAECGFKTCFFNKNTNKKADGIPADHSINRLKDICKIL